MALTKVTSGLTDLDGGITIDNITIDGTEIDLSSGSLTIDVADNIVLDTDGGNIALKDAGTQWGNFANNGGDFEIDSLVQDKDIKFNGNDGGSTITAGFFDMSDGGKLQIGASTVANLNMGRNGDVIEIKAKKDGTDAIDLAFHTQASGGTTSQKMIIKSDGKVMIGGSSPSDTFQVNGTVQFSHAYGTGTALIINNTNADNNYTPIGFRDNGTTVGYIFVNGSLNQTSYVQSSDYRLKENVNYSWNATEKLKQLKPAEFNMIKDEENTVLSGFLAHEVESILPQAIIGEKDAVDGNGDPVYQGIDHSKLVPLLTKAIQELSAKVEELESKINE